MTAASELRKWAFDTSDPLRKKYVRNVFAHVGGLYGAKAFDLVILASVTRGVPMKQVGTAFLAEAIGGALFRLADFGIFPVLFRRAAREEAGPALLAVATLVRTLGVALLTIPFAIVAYGEFPETALLATVIFVLSGGYFIHEPPRAILAGRELFAVTASIGIVAKFVEAVCTVGGLLAGLGIWAWVLGRALSNLGMAAACYVAARRSVRAFPSPTVERAFREGLPFWFSSATSAALSQTDTFVVSAYLGTAETARLGIATRVIGGLLSAVSSMTSVAFPELARQNRRFASPTQVGTMTVVALGMTTGLLLLAPFGVRVVTGHFDPGATSILRALSPVVALVTINRSLSAWLQAKNKERSMATLNVASSAASALAMFALVPAFGTIGAALGRVFSEAIGAAGFLGLAYVAAHRITDPIAWVVSRVPGVPTLVRARLDRVVATRAARFAEMPGVETVEVSGSAHDRRLFVPGRSDIDFQVTTRARGEELVATLRHCQRAAPARFVGPVNVQVIHPDVLRWLRKLGNPVFASRDTRVLFEREPARDGPAARDLDVDVESARHWELSHAVALAVRVQRDALEDARHDGATRTDRIAKDFRFLLQRLDRHTGGTFACLEREGFALPAWLAGTEPGLASVAARPDWLSPATTREVLRAAERALSLAAAAECAEFAEFAGGSAAPRSAPWLSALGESMRGRAERFAAIGAEAVELTPTGPTDDDPLFLVTAEGWSEVQWAEWQREALRQGRLRPPFRSYRWPVVLPPAVLRADVFMEHAPLFHAARAAGRLEFAGTAVAGRNAPPDVLRAAALRETVLALVRIPGDQARLRREPVFAPALLDDPTTLEAEWRFRVRAYVSGRLAALSLLVDQGDAPPTRAGVVATYTASYDDALATHLREAPAETTGARIANVLDDWASARIERLQRELP